MSEDKQTQVADEQLGEVGGGSCYAVDDIVGGAWSINAESYGVLIDFTSRVIERLANALKT